MHTLRDEGVLSEVKSGTNFGYVLENSADFANTDYKVLQSQTSGIFLRCMKLMYNGKIELFYLTEELCPIASLQNDISADMIVTFAVNLFADIIEVRNNGFLSCQNIDLAWDKIFVSPGTLKVKLVYLPVKKKVYENYAVFESELRSGLVKLINQVIAVSNPRLDQFVPDLCNGLLSLDDIYNKSRQAGSRVVPNQKGPKGTSPAGRQQNGGRLRMVSMNSAAHFEIVFDKDETVIGKKAESVDAVITFNKMISRRHCKVNRSGGLYFITDIGSANGTFVNQIRLMPNQPHQINKGDIVRLANSDFQIV